MYASSPYKRILGIVKVKTVRCASVKTVWNETKESAGISRTEFFEYFLGTDTAYAIAIDPSKTIRLDQHISPSAIESGFVVPQSFKYINSTFVKTLLAWT